MHSMLWAEIVEYNQKNISLNVELGEENSVSQYYHSQNPKQYLLLHWSRRDIKFIYYSKYVSDCVPVIKSSLCRY